MVFRGTFQPKICPFFTVYIFLPSHSFYICILPTGKGSFYRNQLKMHQISSFFCVFLPLTEKKSVSNYPKGYSYLIEFNFKFYKIRNRSFMLTHPISTKIKSKFYLSIKGESNHLNRNRLNRRSRHGCTKSNRLFSITLRCFKKSEIPPKELEIYYKYQF